MKRIIPIYIIKELLPTFFISLLVLTFILLMAKVLELTELVVVKGVQAETIFKLLGLSIPFSLSMTIPMSTLLAVLLAFLRLSGDNEITVLKSAGVSLYQLLPPVVLFCLWTYLLTSFLTMYIVPSSSQVFRNEMLDLAKARADVSIKERVFHHGFKDMVLYVNHMPLGSDIMENIFIQDERDKEVISVIVAARGRIATDTKQRALIFQLFDGLVDRVRKNLDTTDTIAFKRYELKLDLEGAEEGSRLIKRDQYELPLHDLWTAVEELKVGHQPKYYIYLMEAHKRFSLPFACLVLGLVAVPLGLQVRGKGRNIGITMGLVVFLVYYVFLSAGVSFGKNGAYPPVLGMWMPNLIIGAPALWMLRQANHEASIGLDYLINKLISWFRSLQRNEKN